MIIIRRSLTSAAFICSLLFAFHARSETVPSTLLYEGRILDGSRNPITSTVYLRFSFWKSADWTASDGSGSEINTNAANYGEWVEAQTVTPNSNGVVAVQLGSSTVLPTLDYAKHKFLQVEIKSSVDAAYVLLDPTGDSGSDAIDRKFIGSVAYAKNAERVGNRAVGTASGDLLVLGEGGKTGAAQMGSGTDSLSFKINYGDAPGNAALFFGNNLLSEALRFSAANDRFEFSNDVYVAGNLDVSGTASVSSMHARDSFTASGSAIFGAATRFNGSTTLNGVTYVWPASAAASSGMVLKIDPSTGQLSWSADIDTDTGISQGDADSRYVNSAGLVDCDAPGNKLLWDSTMQRFSCGTDTVATPPDTATFLDTTTESLATSDVDLWDGTYPNISVDAATNTVQVSVMIRLDADANDDETDAFYITRETDGTDPTCSDVRVGDVFYAGFTTHSTDVAGASAVLLDTPGVVGTVKYTVCSDAANTTGTDSNDTISVRVNLVEMGD